MGSQTHSQLPIVDFTSQNMKPSTGTWVSACQVVRSALEDHGGFLALYDKVSLETHNSTYSAMENFFDLSIESKWRKTTEKPIFSYSGQRQGIPLYESVGIMNPLSYEDCQKYTNVVWPKGNDLFCESVNSYAKQLVELDHIVKRMVFESYGLEMKKFESLLESTDYVLRGYKYRTPQVGETNVGVAPHSDTALLTILNQKVEGLGVKLKDEEWFEVGVSPSLYLVMAGDAMRVWSNDRIRACEHRVLINSMIERYSIGLLSYAAKIMEPEAGLVDEEHPLRYKSFDHYGYLRFFLTEEAIKSESRIKAYCGI
ncbi:probable 2-oxoglutarate-dependent dioxygenase AOP1 [Cajanus cajan]|uniref:Gibberellin 20 oxidase 1 n=1 Tax=Cajanus cajan TaxID=3821 RepID=A0A151U300_CAJCA|nr:probable 2-oxoglutarate-dependent dioxygenase AOP1 [Cajanus cajan]KYP73677.1 Gibberellin 20 oxidase 1 [Cajanus cajan]